MPTPCASAPLVSVVIPVWRDSIALGELLATLPDRDVVEVIVAHAGPADATLDEVRAAFGGVRWADCAVGRGEQLNCGAALARGRWILFLHADSRLPAGWRDEIDAAERDGRAVAGCFRFHLDSRAPAARLIERGVAWRVRWLRLPYGDQALFVRRDVFEALGGYRPYPVMEDVDLVRRLGRRGRVWVSAVPVTVSPRRWERDGWWRRSAANVRLLTLFLCGVSPHRLARWYYREPEWREDAGSEDQAGRRGEPGRAGPLDDTKPADEASYPSAGWTSRGHQADASPGVRSGKGATDADQATG